MRPPGQVERGGPVSVGRVEPGETLALRHQVLRPHEPLAALEARNPTGGDAVHVAARDTDGVVIATAVVRRRSPPWAEQDDAWQLLGMATAPAWRGRGVGGAVLEEAVRLARLRGAALVWCNARVTALAFYRSRGFPAAGRAVGRPAHGTARAHGAAAAAAWRRCGREDLNLHELSLTGT